MSIKMEANGQDYEEKDGGNEDIDDFMGMLHSPGLFTFRLLMTGKKST